METEFAEQVHRRRLVGGSDARIIVGNDEAALVRLGRENEARPSRRTFRAI
jgi:hypothetical protein